MPGDWYVQVADGELDSFAVCSVIYKHDVLRVAGPSRGNTLPSSQSLPDETYLSSSSTAKRRLSFSPSPSHDI